MKTELSAGGIVLAKTQSIWHVLLIQDINKSWTFPKGLIEPNENPQEAAEREISEEIGLTNLTYVSTLGTIQYMYRRNGLIRKTVHYFLFQSDTQAPLKPQREEGISEARWVALEEAETLIGYPETNTKLLHKARQIVINL